MAQIILTPDKLGFISQAEAERMGATAQELQSLDYLLMHGRKHYRRIDVQRIAPHRHV